MSMAFTQKKQQAHFIVHDHSHHGLNAVLRGRSRLLVLLVRSAAAASAVRLAMVLSWLLS